MCYLQYHPVAVDSKFRIVFDGSAKTTSGQSLNDIQLTGEKLQDDLPIIIIKFRMCKIAMTTDITKMYRQVLISDRYVNYQRILYRKASNLPILDLILLTDTYGTRGAAHTAI